MHTMKYCGTPRNNPVLEWVWTKYMLVKAEAIFDTTDDITLMAVISGGVQKIRFAPSMTKVALIDSNLEQLRCRWQGVSTFCLLTHRSRRQRSPATWVKQNFVRQFLSRELGADLYCKAHSPTLLGVQGFGPGIPRCWHLAAGKGKSVQRQETHHGRLSPPTSPWKRRWHHGNLIFRSTGETSIRWWQMLERSPSPKWKNWSCENWMPTNHTPVFRSTVVVVYEIIEQRTVRSRELESKIRNPAPLTRRKTTCPKNYKTAMSTGPNVHWSPTISRRVSSGLQSENGLPVSPLSYEGDEDAPDHPGKQTANSARFVVLFQCWLFAKIRRHIDLAISSMEADHEGTLANYMIAGKLVKGVGVQWPCSWR